MNVGTMLSFYAGAKDEGVMAALVCGVNENGSVDILTFDSRGKQQFRPGVQVSTDGKSTNYFAEEITKA